jgi:hypothetical protein
MFGTLLANGVATWCGALAQSGCLTYGSLLADQRRQSAIRHRTGGLSVLKAASARIVAGKPTHNRHPAVVASPHLTGARSRLPWARINRGRRNLCGSPSPEALASLSNVEVVTGSVCSRPVLRQSGWHWRPSNGCKMQSIERAKEVSSCKGQTSATKYRSSCSQRPRLRAPA